MKSWTAFDQGMKKYRIIEKTYGDNHKEYTAQYLFLNFGLFKIWKNYICDVRDYGYAKIGWICTGKTFDECKKRLLETIQKKKAELDSTRIISIKKYYL